MRVHAGLFGPEVSGFDDQFNSGGSNENLQLIIVCWPWIYIYLRWVGHLCVTENENVRT